MRKFNENTLRNMSRHLSNSEFYNNVDVFINDLDDMIIQILEAQKFYDVSYSIRLFGDVSREGVISVSEPINVAIILENQKYFENCITISKYKRIQKKRKESLIEQTKILLLILIEQYFHRKVLVKSLDNSLLVDAINFVGANFKMFVFTNSFEDPKTLITTLTSNMQLGYFNIEKYEHNFQTKNLETNGSFSKVCNVVKYLALEYNISNDMLLLENFLYNSPSELFKGFLNDQIFNIMNYYTINPFNQLFSIDKNNMNLSKDLFTINNSYLLSIKTFNKIVELFA